MPLAPRCSFLRDPAPPSSSWARPSTRQPSTCGRSGASLPSSCRRRRCFRGAARSTRLVGWVALAVGPARSRGDAALNGVPGRCATQIFKLLGVPNDETWPGFSKMPLFKSINPVGPPWVPFLHANETRPNISGRRRRRYSSLRKKFQYLTEEGHDLLASLLSYDPARRINAEAGGQHAYFRCVGGAPSAIPFCAELTVPRPANDTANHPSPSTPTCSARFPRKPPASGGARPSRAPSRRAGRLRKPQRARRCWIWCSAAGRGPHESEGRGAASKGVLISRCHAIMRL